MRVAVRRLRLEDVEKLQALVVENFDAIEPGLTVLDARLLLGHATIDVMGTDTAGALVLGTVGFTANEEMLLKAVEAYSWCLEYPEAVVRHYPSCQLSEARPPRLLFVVERMPDAFHRKIKQLGFPEVDCVEVRHLEFDGTPTVYFESLLRLRRPVVPAATRVVEPKDSGPPSGGASQASANVVPMTRPAVRATGVENAGLVVPTTSEPVNEPRAAERTADVRDAAPVVSMVSRHGAAPAPRAPHPGPATEPAVVREPEPLVMADPDASLELDPVVASLCEPMAEPAVAPAPTFGRPSVPPVRPIGVDAVPAIAPTHVVTATAPAPERVSFKDLATALLAKTTETREAVADAVATAVVKPNSGRSGSVGTTAASSVAPVAPALESHVAKPVEEPKLAAPALPEGFEGLKFPNDGVLTRQWMEFLNQMSTTR
jgi:hypothetical protein